MSPSSGARRTIRVETLRVETRGSEKNYKRLQTREIDSRWWYSVGSMRPNIAFHNSSSKSSQDCAILEEDKSMRRRGRSRRKEKKTEIFETTLLHSTSRGVKCSEVNQVLGIVVRRKRMSLVGRVWKDVTSRESFQFRYSFKIQAQPQP